MKGKFWLKYRFYLTGAIGILIFLLAILGLTNLIKNHRPVTQFGLPAPTPTSVLPFTPTPIQSGYAGDPVIIKADQDLQNLETDLENTDLSETGLNPPILDMEIQF